MGSDLMTVAVCWEIGANVSVEYARNNLTLYYFCPEPNCLEPVISIQGKVNIFFRAPGRHAAGCVHEKESIQASAVPGKQRIFAVATPSTIIPSHLGMIPAVSKRAMPTRAQMLALVQKVQASPVIHPGTLQEVVDAWRIMSVNERHQYQLTISNKKTSYFNAFTLLSQAGGNLSAVNNSSIALGPAAVESSGDYFFIKTYNKFTDGVNRARIRVVVRSNDARFAHLTHGQTLTLFLHTTPTINSKGSFFEIPPSTLYSGFVIT